MSKKYLYLVFLFVMTLCFVHPGNVDADARKQKKIVIYNMQDKKAEVNIDFGAESEINAATMDKTKIKCNARGATNKLNCRFDLEPKGHANDSQEIPNPQFKQVNGKITFNKFPGCGASHFEWSVNMKDNNAQDVLNNSVVDGFNEKIMVTFTPDGKTEPSVKMGPACGIDGNENVYGVYPYGCDGCAIRIAPQSKCGPYPSKNIGCHKGTQYAPVPVCQYQLVETSKDQSEHKGVLGIYLMPKDAPCDKSGKKK